MTQNSNEVCDLAKRLEATQDDQFYNPDICKKTPYRGRELPQHFKISYWKFQDRFYQSSGLPIYAYPLLMGKNEMNDDQIVVRGYNKFFNVEQIASTTWEEIEIKTKGPYEISSIENGCTVLISGLWDGTLLVTSKSPYSSQNPGTSHAEAGERWLEMQLAKLNKSKKNLATELWSRNVTLVAELCDDRFEERVISYTGEKAGLYLHGINANVTKFLTFPGAQVQKFAKEWGFLRQEFVIFDVIKDARAFINDATKSGSYNGRVVKGAVIRCKILRSKLGEYEDFFFKCRIRGLYQIYRQWREYTKAMLKSQFVPRNNDMMTHEYLEFAQRKFLQEPELGRAYLDNHGVIKIREEFLKEKDMLGSSNLKRSLAVQKLELQDVVDNIILVPISTIGCGKTTVSLSLSFLFGWGYVRNNTIEGRNRPHKFAEKVLEVLTKKPVVFADRNNVQKFQRNQLILHISRKKPQARMIALNFVNNEASFENIRKVTQARILPRIDNNLRSDTGLQKDRAVDIMDSFIERFQKLDVLDWPDCNFDAVINLNPTLDSRANLEILVEELRRIFPKLITKVPTTEELDVAFLSGLNKSNEKTKCLFPERSIELPHDMGQNSDATHVANFPNLKSSYFT
ncbi:BgTH12-07272 [Blumeria graminis f. sp. triticale]|uniref:BgTH12-07272 n=1 Tax=Blumeria graminis f. sp. triticale TaxID=1689686 RepID=A0A9W4GIK6_BLUGR|nr:BgTH12-07272 [Blumeria graminis f. sp. triticale]